MEQPLSPRDEVLLWTSGCTSDASDAATAMQSGSEPHVANRAGALGACSCRAAPTRIVPTIRLWMFTRLRSTNFSQHAHKGQNARDDGPTSPTTGTTNIPPHGAAPRTPSPRDTKKITRTTSILGRGGDRGHGAGPCLNDVGLLGGVGANTSAIFGDRSESAELRDAQTMASVGIEGCVGFSRTVSTKPCNTSRSSLPALASPTGEGGRSEADRSSRHKSSNDLEVILGRKVEGLDRPTVWARSRPFPLL